MAKIRNNRRRKCLICGEPTSNWKYCGLCGIEMQIMKNQVPYKTWADKEQYAYVKNRVKAIRKKPNGFFELKAFLNTNTTTNI